MAEIDDELIARAVRWCGEAGRRASSAAVREALAPLSWDEMLAARALLADAPPARPLGPLALADLARGAPVEAAARREREGRYGSAGEPLEAPRRESGARRPRAARARKAQDPIVRHARDRSASAPAAPRSLPLLDALFESEGRATLGRLVRERGARRAALVAALATGWRRADGGSPSDADLDALLEAHGLARAFARRERDEILHAVRAAGGSKGRAAQALGLAPAALDAALERLEAGAAAEAIRDARRAELRRRATLSERVRLVVEEAERLGDLGLLAEFEADLRARLPEHVRALRAAGAAQVGVALARSLAVARDAVEALATRLGLEVAAAPSTGGEPARRGGTRGTARGRPRPGVAPRGPRGPRPPGRGARRRARS